jgi:hypothetical protein
MATIPSKATGDHNVGTNWVGNVAPGPNDFAQLEPTFTITVAAAGWQVKGIIWNGGSLVQNYDVIISDASGAGLTFNAVNSGGYSSNGTASAPRKIYSVASNPMDPTNPWTIRVAKISGKDDRSLDFRFVELQGNLWYLGNETNYLDMQNRQTPGIITVKDIVPPSRESILVENRIKYTTAKVDLDTLGPRTTRVIMKCVDTSWFWDILDNIQTGRQRISFFSRYFHIPKCQIDAKPNHSGGPQYYIADVSLREDV